MATQKITVSLEDEAASFVRAEAERRCGGNVSALMASLVEGARKQSERRRETLQRVAAKLTPEELEALEVAS